MAPRLHQHAAMIAAMALPPGMTVAFAADLCGQALAELEELEPREETLARWLWTTYRNALVVGPRHYWPKLLQTTASIDVLVRGAQQRIAHVRRLASTRGDLTSVLPPRLPVTRVRDAAGRVGFAPMDAPGLTLSTRGLALLLADRLNAVQPTSACLQSGATKTRLPNSTWDSVAVK